MAGHDRDARPPGAAPGATRLLVSERPDPIVLPDWRQGLAEYLAARRGEGGGMNVLVTGGAGFIGSAYVRHRLDDASRRLGPGARQAHLRRAGARTSRASTRRGSSWSSPTSPTPRPSKAALDGCDAIVNFAAETHVDRSIEAPGEFIQTDVFGTYVLLEAARDAGIRHLQISTDEVYGSIEEGSFTESSPIDPSSPYSASKAGGDLMVGAFRHTYGAEALIVRASNNYGPRQYPEKLIPLCILNALAGDPLPVYGDGMQVRNWLWVDDFAQRDRHRARVRRAGRGLQRRRPRRAAQHRGRASGSSSSPAATSR